MTETVEVYSANEVSKTIGVYSANEDSKVSQCYLDHRTHGRNLW